MTDDLVKRLREEHVISTGKYGCVVKRRNPDGPEAADLIEQLQAALREIAELNYKEAAINGAAYFANQIARAALGEKKDGD